MVSIKWLANAGRFVWKWWGEMSGAISIPIEIAALFFHGSQRLTYGILGYCGLAAYGISETIKRHSCEKRLQEAFNERELKKAVEEKNQAVKNILGSSLAMLRLVKEIRLGEFDVPGAIDAWKQFRNVDSRIKEILEKYFNGAEVALYESETDMKPTNQGWVPEFLKENAERRQVFLDTINQRIRQLEEIIKRAT